ncbi:MAG: tetratricopeptide repeat protein [Cyanothece sp. SIO2G6]|nr:tetratricopeptide repeat protein [Cyanothece sp. SIO2G6]
MKSTKASLLVQAKQGDAKAIATLLNQTLQPKGIRAKASVKNSCLYIMLEAIKTPPQQALVTFLRKSLGGLETDAWCTVRLYGRRASEEIPDWVEEFTIKPKNSQDIAVLARQGNAKAIAALINRKLQSDGVVAKVSIKDGCLQVMLEAAQTPNQEQMVSFLKSEVQMLEIQNIEKLRLYGKQSGDDFPDWQEEVTLPVNDSEPCKTQIANIDLQSASEATEPSSTLAAVQEIDGVGLSNQLYQVIQSTCYQCLSHKMSFEDDKTIHEMVQDFVDGLEANLKLDLDKFPQQVINIAESFGIQLERTQLKVIVSDATDSNFTGVRLAIQDLERVTREVLTTDFPEEDDSLKAFFSGAAQEVSAQMVGMTTMSQEAMIGAAIGTIIAPGIGSMVGGAIGEWFGGNKKQKVLEQLIDKYYKSRRKLVQEWEVLLQAIYTNLSKLLNETVSVKLLTYQEMDQAIDCYHQGNKYLEANIEEAVSFFEKSIVKSIQANPESVNIWSNMGFACNWSLKLYGLNKSLRDKALASLVTYQIVDRALDFPCQYDEQNKQNLEEAIKIYDRAIQLNPGLASIWSHKGYALNRLGRFEEALPVLCQALQIDRDCTTAYSNYGDAQQNLGRYEDAIAAYEEVIKLEPSNYQAWSDKGVCLYHLQKAQELLTVAKKLVELDPENFLIWYANAVCYALLEDKKLAIENLKEAIRLNAELSQLLAKANPDFAYLREDKRFQELMESSVGVDYAQLKMYLKEKQWREADQETASLIRLVIQKTSNSTEVKRNTLSKFPCNDLETIDRLWQEHSNGRLGFSVQKKISQESDGEQDFGSKIGWYVVDTDGDFSWRDNTDFDYNFKTMPDGHLPSSLWAGEDGWFENRRGRLIALLSRLDSCSTTEEDAES